MASAAAAAAAGAAMRARREVASWFLAVHAITSEDAAPFVPQTGLQRRQFEWMRQRRIVHEAAPGHYWIDPAAYQADNDRRRGRLALILAPIQIVSALVIAWCLYIR
jgi:hypothetical protein